MGMARGQSTIEYTYYIKAKKKKKECITRFSKKKKVPQPFPQLKGWF